MTIRQCDLCRLILGNVYQRSRSLGHFFITGYFNIRKVNGLTIKICSDKSHGGTGNLFAGILAAVSFYQLFLGEFYIRKVQIIGHHNQSLAASACRSYPFIFGSYNAVFDCKYNFSSYCIAFGL